jgi:hypothetical protein
LPVLLSAHSPEDRARAAATLFARFRRGHVYEVDLLEHGRILLGHDLNARRWHLPGLGKVRVPRRAGLAALRLSLALAVSPRRVRVGAAWVKDAAGRVDRLCIPADLAPSDFGRWLRAETLAQLRQLVAPPEKARREARYPRKYRPVTLDLIGEYTHMMAQGPEQAWITRETLADLLALGCDRDRAIVRLRVEGSSNTEIGEQLGCTDRTVRRRLDVLYRRACAAGILGAGAGIALGAVLHEESAANDAPVAKAA